MGNLASIVLSIVLAFFFGYSLAMRPVLNADVGFRAALGVALAADTVSITVMELVDNAFILAVPGALDAGLADALFWGSLIASLVVAFVVTVPVEAGRSSPGARATPSPTLTTTETAKRLGGTASRGMWASSAPTHRHAAVRAVRERDRQAANAT